MTGPPVVFFSQIGYISSPMARQFDIPIFYRSRIISSIKRYRKENDRRKSDLSPSILDVGKIRFKIARHFGFCFGVENAIEIAYRALDENPDRRVFLLSEMIHNPRVNGDLQERGIRFLQTQYGEQLIPFEELTKDDIVIVPAFGTTVELFERLKGIGIDPQVYNTTCPFVERVWKRASELGTRGYTIIIHGKHTHEETRATFSHARLSGPSVVVRDREQALTLTKYMTGVLPVEEFATDFKGLVSEGFDPERDLQKVGVVNQTTMLASETQEISDLIKEALQRHYGAAEINNHYADTRDTLCYATSENQDATKGLIEAGGDLAIVVGGYNSSNTSHLVELLEEHVPTFYVKDAEEIISISEIRHLDLKNSQVKTTHQWLDAEKERLEVLVTAGASCPDALVDEVVTKISSLMEQEQFLEAAIRKYDVSDSALAVVS
ncbi:MAG: 4-hydroxy-3-methylbut-2-enyl diphosphate reductase [Bdellovibrionales bacterium]|nr:4-hydroxy-3-methylbut-2-enyl diphosphate reductase [Bdellovibrionales bacterium]